MLLIILPLCFVFLGLIQLTEQATSNRSTKFDDYTVASADEFTYHDPVDKSVSAHQVSGELRYFNSFCLT